MKSFLQTVVWYGFWLLNFRHQIHTHTHTTLCNFSHQSFHCCPSGTDHNEIYPSIRGVWLNNLCSMFVPVCQGLLFSVSPSLLLLLWSERLLSLPGPLSQQWWRGQLLAEGDDPFQGRRRETSIIAVQPLCLCLPIREDALHLAWCCSRRRLAPMVATQASSLIKLIDSLHAVLTPGSVSQLLNHLTK